MGDWHRDAGIVSDEGKALPKVLNSLLEQSRCHTKLGSCLREPPIECHEAVGGATIRCKASPAHRPRQHLDRSDRYGRRYCACREHSSHILIETIWGRGYVLREGVPEMCVAV